MLASQTAQVSYSIQTLVLPELQRKEQAKSPGNLGWWGTALQLPVFRGKWGQAFNSFLSKIQDENVTNFASFSVCPRRTATGPGCLVEGGRRLARSLR